jgi:extracellular elastinolytic metalloproteinase
VNRRRSSVSHRPLVFLALATWLIAGGVVLASEKPGHPGNQGRAFDARNEIVEGLAANPTAAQRAAQERVGRNVLDLAVIFDAATGAARSVSSHTGYLTKPTPTEQTPLSVGLAFAQANSDLLGLTEADLAGYEVTDEVFSEVSGVTHLYLRQTYAGLPLYNGQLQLHVNREGRLLSVNNAFLPNLARAVNTTTPTVDAATAVALAARSAGIDAAVPQALGEPSGVDQRTKLDNAGLSRQPIEARLMLLPIRAGQARLVWNFQIETLDGENWYDFTVDAVSGKVWTRFDWIADASYRVYPIPVESPNHTTPLPTADGRTLLVNPNDTMASPFGWHDTNGAAGAEFTIHRGNNTHSWEDSDGNDTPPPVASEPDCGAGLLCDFPINLAGAPSTYRPAAVTNLFYWNNIIHDVLWHYGFNEVGGNFQVNNYGNGGLGNDDVMSLAQAAGNCNANFGTPPDGQQPRMRMFTCNGATPSHDGDLDHGVITHEFCHGVSNRLVGGPANVSCLQNSQQPGEGWSDWYGLVLTALATDTGPMPRGVGTYLLGQPTTGPGVRTQRYSTDQTVNTWTYTSIAGMAVPHGVGSVWAQAIWEVYWALVNEHGFDPDVYNNLGNAGNQRALAYVTEGLKDTACGPSFLDTRNGIIQAATTLHGGEDVCLIWEAFAAFGLGVNAATPGPSATTATNGFNLPASCLFLDSPNPVANICAGQDASYTITAGQAFTAPVTLSAMGNPSPSTVSFTPNPITVIPGSSKMTVTNTTGVAAGSYPITVTGTDPTPQSSPLPVTLNVFVGNPVAPALTAPANGSVGAALRPILTWSAAVGAASYTVQVATDAAFANIVYTASSITGTSHTVGSNLAANTLHFWRVIPTNPCGTGTASSAFTFTTVNLICAMPNLSIPDAVPAGVTTDMVVPSGGALTDLNVTLKVTHTWVGDLIFKLTKVGGGPTVTFFDRPGVPASTNGCSGDNIDATLDDEAATPVETQCAGAAPTISGSFSPNNPLSAFDGQALAGTWRLTASDNAGADLGTVTEWCLAPTTTLPIGIFSDGFESGNTSAWSGTSPLLP